MKIIFIICEVILIASLLLTVTFGIRLFGESAWISGKILFLGAIIIATVYFFLINITQNKILTIVIIMVATVLALVSAFTLPKIFLSHKHKHKEIIYNEMNSKIKVIFNEESAIYKDSKIVNLKFNITIDIPKNLANKKYKPILEMPFLADKHEGIYLSLMKTKNCGIIKPNIPCKIINNKDHASFIEWPKLAEHNKIYFMAKKKPLQFIK